MPHQSRLLVSRLKSIIYCISVALLFIAVKLFHMQINLTTVFFRLSQRNFLRHEKTASPRGNILDSKGVLLATNRPITAVYWNGSGHRTLDEEQRIVLQILEEILQKSLLDNPELELAERKNKKLALVHDISFDQLSRILEQFPSHKNIVITTTFKRFYPYNTLASHVVGYLGSLTTEGSGKMGLEKMFEDTLKGTSGEIVKTINSVGKNLTEEEVKKALVGDNIQTTIDLDLQIIAEEVFPPEHAGVFIVMEAQTGALQVVLSRPSFDPNIFLNPIQAEEWALMQDKHPFLNRAFGSCYPPASLFKLVTIAAALETKLITTDSTWYCNGEINFCGRPYHCSRLTGHGCLTLKEVLAKSCNIPFYEMGRYIKIDTLAEYAGRLGLGKPTNIIFPEKTGLIPTRQWKRKTKGEPWWPGETLSAAIGQSFLLITPLQAARMVSALCEGYLIKPRILVSEPIEQEKLDLSPETLQFLQESMKQTIKHGTGQPLNTLRNIEIHGKTGTAQTSSLEKRDTGSQFLEHAWFVGHVRYKNHNPITLMIFIENTGSSRSATAVAKTFLTRYCNFLDQS